jgi:AcrR family transcriptional regulator
LPKHIENAREQLLDEVRHQISERGYSKTTIRSVAKACGLGLGTVYNYFKSKDMLIASVVAEDWQNCTAQLKNSKPSTKEETIKLIFDMLKSFTEKHKDLFTDTDAIKKFSSIYSEKHEILRNQIANFILPVCKDDENKDDANKDDENKDEGNEEFLSQFIAEALLSWTMEDVPFEKFYSILKRLINETNKEKKS